MEGSRTSAALAVVALVGCALAVGGSGCGGDDSEAGAADGIGTASPEKTFAPLLKLAPDEPWRPMSARWFIERSVLWFANEQGCADRKIAVGRMLPVQRSAEIDWIYPKGLGGWAWPAYYRNPYDARCELDFDERFYADELTRPHDPGPRAEAARPGEGFYLDLADEARGGPRAGAAPVYVERTDEGDSGVRLTYWTLFGMHGADGHPGAHEGDWERVDVLLRAAGEDRYEPVAVQVVLDEPAPETLDGTVAELGGHRARETEWAEARRVGVTHPVVRLDLVTHRATVMLAGENCTRCRDWPAWRSLADAREQLWYGFGGAWGEVGPTSATTGPLGPHSFWPSASQKERQIREQQREIAGG